MPETSATAAETPVFPEGRYGRRRGPRRASRLVTGLVALAVGVAGAAIGLQLFRAYGDGDYTASVTGFTDVTDRQIVIELMVRLPEDGTAVCLLRARDTTGAETGREEITVKAGPDPSRTLVTHTLATAKRPVTGEVQGCRPA